MINQRKSYKINYQSWKINCKSIWFLHSPIMTTKRGGGSNICEGIDNMKQWNLLKLLVDLCLICQLFLHFNLREIRKVHRENVYTLRWLSISRTSQLNKKYIKLYHKVDYASEIVECNTTDLQCTVLLCL